jgi:hypothetical protein
VPGDNSELRSYMWSPYSRWARYHRYPLSRTFGRSQSPSGRGLQTPVPVSGVELVCLGCVARSLVLNGSRTRRGLAAVLEPHIPHARGSSQWR